MTRDNIMSQIDLPTDFDFQQAGRQVLEIEREGLAQLDQYINEDFTRACETIFRCGGKVVVMGMGKSGHIGRKMAATFASTGTSAFLSTRRSRARRFGHGYAAGRGDCAVELRRIERNPRADPGPETPAGEAYLHHQPA